MDRRALKGFACRGAPVSRPGWRELGLTVIELLIVIALLGIVSAIGVPTFLQQLERMRVLRAIADIKAIESEINSYENLMDVLPADLDALDVHARQDPWGRPYVYFRFGGPGWRGEARKDRFLVPINSAFDLYSVGRDGESRPPLQNPKSLDDVVRANDGAFCGLGREF